MTAHAQKLSVERPCCRFRKPVCQLQPQSKEARPQWYKLDTNPAGPACPPLQHTDPPPASRGAPDRVIAVQADVEPAHTGPVLDPYRLDVRPRQAHLLSGVQREIKA